MEIVGLGGYEPAPGSFVEILRTALESMHAGTRFYDETDSMALAPTETADPMLLSVVNSDCLEAAAVLISEGYRPAVLNMANRRNPGGGVHGGAGAQEENLFRRSTAFYSLYQYSRHAEAYGVPEAPDGRAYPIPRESGGIYSPRVLVFRSSEETGYTLLPRPYAVAMLTVPAIPDPDLEHEAGPEPRLTRRMVLATLRKIRAILRIAGRHDHDALVPSAFGCGAFGNPPTHMAELFGEALDEPEFAGRFSRVVFAILDDHNAGRSHNPEGNYQPFRRVLIEHR